MFVDGDVDQSTQKTRSQTELAALIQRGKGSQVEIHGFVAKSHSSGKEVEAY